MKILMIGNGFDLEHDLPTKYVDFLEFIRKFNLAYLSRNNKATLRDINDDYFYTIFTDPEYENRVDALYILTSNNLWIEYFQKVVSEHMRFKENWIDFECEISRIIQTLDQMKQDYTKVKGDLDGETHLLDYYNEALSQIIKIDDIEENTIKNCTNILLYDLNRLIGALEIYIYDYIFQKPILYYNPDIDEIVPDKVISFNYSDTYKKIYSYNKHEIEYCFVHGKAQNNMNGFPAEENPTQERIDKSVKRNAEANNMVLGIEEYLPEDRRSKETEFIEFKKYYQRIYKRTGNEYKKWIKQIDENVTSDKKDKDNTLYIFGHSLDVTDGDIIRDFINNDNIQTIIYYRNKEHLGQLIKNLVKVLECDNLISYVYGSTPRIVFKQQSTRKKIEGSAFEITSDSIQLQSIYMKNSIDANYLIAKIKRKIREKDIKYFYSQEKVITLFDIIQRLGLSKLYEEDLSQIAHMLMQRDGINEPKQYDENQWSYQDYDNSVGCDSLTSEFINSLNTYNKWSFYRLEKAEDIIAEDIFTFHEQLVKYKKMIREKDEIDKQTYNEIVSCIFHMFYDRAENIKELWDFLIWISTGPARKVSEEALHESIQVSKDELDIIYYNHLLKEIKENE